MRSKPSEKFHAPRAMHSMQTETLIRSNPSTAKTHHGHDEMMAKRRRTPDAERKEERIQAHTGVAIQLHNYFEKYYTQC